MNRYVAILLALIFLSQTFSYAVSELAKLDELIEHARMHSQEYGDSFLTFISKHYGDQQREHSSDHQEHDNLPFHHTTAVHLLVMFMGPDESSEDRSFFTDPDTNKRSFYRESMSKYISQEIFQPPIIS